jgi:amino acid permease
MVSSGTPAAVRAASIILFCIGIVCILLLFLQYLDVYFSLDGTRLLATDDEALRYWWTAGICVTTMAAAFILASVARKRRSSGFGVAGLVGLLLAIAASVAFAIPSEHAKVNEESYPLPSNYQPCYSGSGDCN